MAAEDSSPPQSAVEDLSRLQPLEFVAAILSLPQSFWVGHNHFESASSHFEYGTAKMAVTDSKRLRQTQNGCDKLKWLWRTRVFHSRLWRTWVLHSHLMNLYLLEKYKWKWNVLLVKMWKMVLFTRWNPFSTSKENYVAMQLNHKSKRCPDTNK